MIFNSQGAAELKTYINGGSIIPGDNVITLPKGGELLGDLTIEAVAAGSLEVTPNSEHQIFTPPDGEYYNRVTVGAAQGGNGQYAWEKSISATFSFTQLSSGTPTILQVASNDIDVTTITSDAFVGLNGSVNATTYNFTNNHQVIIGGQTWEYTYDQTTARITIQISITSGTWANATARVVIGYIVSDDSTEYPNGGELNGYWYELIGKDYLRELDYIQSSGTQHIDTGVKPNQNTRVVMDFEPVEAYSSMNAYFGVRDVSTSSTAASQYITWNNGAKTLRSDYFKTNVTLTITNLLSRKILDKNKNVTKVDGVSATNTANSGQCSYSMFLFAINNAGAVGFNSKIKLYSCKVYDNGTLIRNFIPVLDFSGVACLYDKVEKKFYYNQGSGSFAYELAA